MKKILSLLLILFVILTLVSCEITGGLAQNGGASNSGENISGGSSGTPDDNTGNTPDDNIGNTPNDGSDNSSGGNSGDITPDPAPDYPDGELEAFNELFDPKNHVYIWLDISDSELKKIQQDYENYSSMGSKSPIYRMADMVVKITKPNGSVLEWTIEQVGVRMKGNTSRTSFYSDNDGMYNLVHFKISFGETFDNAEYYGSDALTWTDSAARMARKDRTFATLEKIDMKWNRNDDTTYIREIYSYDLYREFGVLSPHTALASTDIGSDHAGIFVIYEPIDKIFLEKNLPQAALGGDLYKLGWTNEGATFTSFSSYGIEDEDNCQFYVYDLKTNKKTSDHSSLRNLISTINSNGLTKDEFASAVDIENLMYYCAVSYMVGNPDDLRNNYNNTYIYFRPDTGKLLLIPYDMDRGLGVNTWNPYNHGMTKDDPFATYNVCGDQRNPLFLKSVCSGGMFISEYIEALKKVDESEMLTNAGFESRFELAASLYSGDATPSKSYNNAGDYKFRFDIDRTCSASESKNMSFVDYISAKRTTLYQAIGDQGDVDNGGESTDSEVNDNYSCYIRSSFTGWSNDDNYKLTNNGDGTYTITFTRSEGFEFKVYNDTHSDWFGGEILDENCQVSYQIDGGHGNICLDAGTYTVTYDANADIIYITN